MSDHVYITEGLTVDIRRVNNVEHERAVRAYGDCGNRLALQVRGPLLLSAGPDGKEFVVAHSTLDVAGMRALRAIIDERLADVRELEAPEPPADLTPRTACALLRRLARLEGASPDFVHAVGSVLDHVKDLERVVDAIAAATEDALAHRPPNAVLSEGE